MKGLSFVPHKISITDPVKNEKKNIALLLLLYLVCVRLKPIQASSMMD